MIAVLTADIIRSEDFPTAIWMDVIKTNLSRWGSSPKDWEIYRGDEFQLRTEPQKALLIALDLKARIKRVKGLDVRISIGIGEEDYFSGKVSESNGTAYRRSGRKLEQLKQEGKNLGIDGGTSLDNRTFNLILDLASDFMDSWSEVSSEIVSHSLAQPGITQTEMAIQLGIKQSAVSQRKKRARLDLVNEVLEYYENHIKTLE